MKKQFIKDLKAKDTVRSFFVAKHKQLEYFRDRSKGRFLSIILTDRTGHMLARSWERASERYEEFEEGDIIAVAGRVEEYLGRPQIIINRLRQARAEDKDVHYGADDFVPRTEKDVDDLWATVTATVNEMTNPHLKTLVHTMLDGDLAAGFRAAPGSKAMHHPYRGGLLEHTVEMLTLAQCLMTLYPRLDHDLLTAGIILHHVGLVEGTRYEREIDYSDAGHLAGYVVLGDRLVAERIAALPGFPPDLALLLSHMILSSPGETEFGAVCKPQTLEAVALALLRRLSAEVNHVQQVLDAQWDANKPWTEHDRILDRSFFRGRSHEPEPAPEGPGETPSAADLADEHGGTDLPALLEQRAKYAGPRAEPKK